PRRSHASALLSLRWMGGRLFLQAHVHTATAQSSVNTFRCGSKVHLHAVLLFHLHPRTSAGNGHASTRPDVMAVEIGQALKIVHLTSGRASAYAYFAYGHATDRDRIFLALVGKSSL